MVCANSLRHHHHPCLPAAVNSPILSLVSSTDLTSSHFSLNLLKAILNNHCRDHQGQICPSGSKMVLKRKRSDCELGSVFSSEQRLDSGCFNFNSMSAMDTARRGFFAPRVATPSHLPSRTMKRFRDNRPSEGEVYRKFSQAHFCPFTFSPPARLSSERTLDVLYSAQRRPHEPQHVQAAQVSRADAPTQAHAQSHYSCQQQRSLHSFWNLPPGPASSASSLALSPAPSNVSSPSPAVAPQSVATNCEDCGVGLGDSDGDVMMDVDGYALGLEDRACGACGKAVCFSCSVSNLGEHRRCLSCAGPRGGVAGSSWFRR